MLELGDPWDAQRSPNKITMVEKNNWVSSAQSCNEESENIKQTFMNKKAVHKEPMMRKTISRSSWKRTFNPAAKNSNYLGKMTRMEGSQKLKK